MKSRQFLPEKPWFLAVAIAGLIAGALLLSNFTRATNNSLLCSLAGSYTRGDADYSTTTTTTSHLLTILHYATSRVVPQQSLAEIRVSFDVLQSLSPCNFLVFGLGHDSLMWSSFNPQGATIFLEEDPKWVQTVLKNAPNLRAHTVRYRTRLSEANDLLSSYRSEPDCLPPNVFLRGNKRCKLALTGLPSEVYNKEWDLIMIDAPRGYFPDAPGRMAAIFSAAVMARARTRPGVTHVFLHDVNRKVEKTFAKEFLCRKYLVKAVGRLWHFQIPPAANVSATSRSGFC
ncbi:hypothetical protein HHK36_007580 [Tetracentron sinense]|uniref:Polysaccharide biosynthesis domain-containing protein n=1 Tax=Tetracentron sinense TaxID=13715 RepID=A0A834ZNP1_TETSI|nr:hypothetical protein HHK36_007580 [Tetracentron sinense]